MVLKNKLGPKATLFFSSIGIGFTFILLLQIVTNIWGNPVEFINHNTFVNGIVLVSAVFFLILITDYFGRNTQD